MERVTTLVRRPVIVPGDLDFLGAVGPGTERSIDWLAGTLPEAVARLEIEMIRRALEACAGNRAQAALRLGVRRQLLYQKLARYGRDLFQNGTEGVPKADADPSDSTSDASGSQ
jgi:DNA-binding NtrC family response regulator